ncbi:MAG TPA: A24 family peptidase [Gaiellaceae bacterium]|nr:A24 family peptidase [Gaiellaceae bacterium]
MSGVLDALVVAGVAAVLAWIAAIDVRRRIVPNRIVLPAAAAVLALRTLAHPSPVWFLAGLGAAGFLLAAALARPGAMGMGDVKLALLIGFAAGPDVVLALLVACCAGALPGLWLALRGRAVRGATIPFAPFLALGGAAGLLAGAL